MLKLWRKTEYTHEELFIERYDQMLLWALQLTSHNRQQAEDLVHDVFIQFYLLHPDLGSIQNLEGYLFTMLRNLHRSQMRRAMRTPGSHLSLLDFDSADLGLQGSDLRAQVQFRDELRMICRYACMRKQSSKAGSVLILRFFHGYFPSEIALVLQSSRQPVAELLRVARFEAKLYLDDPTRLSFLESPGLPPSEAEPDPRDLPDFLVEARETIFASRQDECLGPKQLRSLYRGAPAQSIDARLLAHIVSCHQCLDEVNGLLGLAPLADRFAIDTLGPDTTKKDGPGGSSGPPGGDPPGSSTPTSVVRKYRRKLKQVLEHTPKELHISVNGFFLGSQKVSSDLNEFTLSVDLTERPEFIEVFSEQGIRLLSLNVDPPPSGSFEHFARANLSDGRNLEARVSFGGPWPSVHIVYHDPTLSAEPSPIGADLSAAERPLVPPQESPENSMPDVFSSKTAGKSRAGGLLRLLPGRGFWLRPATITAVLVLIAAGVFLLRWRGPSTPVSALDLLHRAALAEQSAEGRTDLVLHRTIDFEETSGGKVTNRRRIEVWKSAERGITARRLYDAQGSLIKGDWRRADGVQTLYSLGQRATLRQLSGPAALSPSSFTFDNVWQLALSADEFAQMFGQAQAGQMNVEDRRASYSITYRNNNTQAAGLARAVLVLGRADLHPVEQAVAVNQGGEQREYRFVEVSYDRRPINAVPPAVFEPDPGFLGAAAKHSEHETLRASSSPQPMVPPRAIATADLEVDALRRLNQVGALSGEQVSLTRTAEGTLIIEGIVESGERKDEILHSLGTVAENPAVQVSIQTVNEAVTNRKSQRSENISVERLQSSGITIAVDKELREYFSKTRGLTGDRLDQEIRRFSDRVLSESREARRHALALKQISERFSVEDLNSLGPDARQQWHSLMVQQTRAVRENIEELVQELHPIFPAAQKSAASNLADVEVRNETDFARVAKRIFEIVSQIDEGIRDAFSISDDRSGLVRIRSPQFFSDFDAAIATAHKFEQRALTGGAP